MSQLRSSSNASAAIRCPGAHPPGNVRLRARGGTGDSDRTGAELHHAQREHTADEADARQSDAERCVVGIAPKVLRPHDQADLPTHNRRQVALHRGDHLHKSRRGAMRNPGERQGEDIARLGLLQGLCVRSVVDDAGAETGMLSIGTEN